MRSLRPFLIAFAVAALVAAPVLADKQADEAEYLVKPWSLSSLPVFNEILADVNETEPNDTCPGNAYTFLDVFHGELVADDLDWVTFECTAGWELTIGTDADGALPTVDTVIELYADDCSTMLTSNDDGGPGLYSLISAYETPYTGTYNLKIRGYSGSSVGNYTLLGNCEEPTGPCDPPPNDTCATAIAIPRCGTFTDSGCTEVAVADYPLTSGSCTGYSSSGGDVVYVMDLLAGDMVTAVYQNEADATLYLITDCSDPQNSCVIGADDTLTGGVETFDYTVVADGTYYLICSTYSASTPGGLYDLTVDIECPISVDGQTWGETKALYR
jgi:hypothetical protein